MLYASGLFERGFCPGGDLPASGYMLAFQLSLGFLSSSLFQWWGVVGSAPSFVSDVSSGDLRMGGHGR
eukprot:2229615-Amphidinium_carterae.1